MPSLPQYAQIQLPESAAHHESGAASPGCRRAAIPASIGVMLGDLDQSVAAFLGRLLPAGTAIRFDAPVASWADAPPAAPLLGVYLYDIREAPQPPAADAVLARDEAGRPVGWQLPVRKYQVSYLLTAWPDDA